MGLDQSAGKQGYKHKIEFKNGENFSYVGLGPFEWRKHARLQEFMTRLAMKKKGKEPTDINKLPDGIKETKKAWYFVDGYWYPWDCGEFELIFEDIAKLKKAVENGYKDYYCEMGYLWGQKLQEEQIELYKKRDLEFVDYALNRIENGEKVYYRCSF